MVSKPAFFSRLRKHAWSIRDLFWFTVYAAIVLVMWGKGRYHWPSWIWIGLMSGLAYCSVRQVVLLIRGREVPFDLVTGRTLRWSLAATRAVAVILLLIGTRWPEPNGWWSHSEPSGDLMEKYPLVNGYDYGYFWSFAMRDQATSLILPMGILFACVPLWSMRRVVNDAASNRFSGFRRLVGKSFTIVAGMMIGLVIISQLQTINSLVFIAIRGMSSGIRFPGGINPAHADWGRLTSQYFDEASVAAVAGIVALISVLAMIRCTGWTRLLAMGTFVAGSWLGFRQCLLIRTVTLPSMLGSDVYLGGWPEQWATVSLFVVLMVASWLLVWIFLRGSRLPEIELDPVRLAKVLPPSSLMGAMGIWICINSYVVGIHFLSPARPGWPSVFYDTVWVHGRASKFLFFADMMPMGFLLFAFLMIWAGNEIVRRRTSGNQFRIVAISTSPSIGLLILGWFGIATSILLIAESIGQLSRATFLVSDNLFTNLFEGILGNALRFDFWASIVSFLAILTTVLFVLYWAFAALKRWMFSEPVQHQNDIPRS